MEHISAVIQRVMPELLNPMTNYEKVTNQVIAQLRQGTVPWQTPYLVERGMPHNLATGKRYRGINVWLLGTQDFDNPYWLTYQQAQTLGGHIRKGERGTMIMKFGTIDVPDEDTKEIKRKSYLKTYTVFNARQTKDINIPIRPQPPGLEQAVRKAAFIVAKMRQRPRIVHAPLHRPSYSRLEDLVRMPPQQAFINNQYYPTLFHELVHSTGHHSRLDRLVPPNADKHERLKDYSIEELIAEMGAAYLNAECGLHPEPIQEAAYIKSWATALSEKDHETWVVKAAGKAQQATDFILDQERQQENDPHESEQKQK